MEKKCNKCGLVKPLDQFPKDSKGQRGYRAYCKACAGKYMAQYLSQEVRGRYHQLRSVAVRKKIHFDISPEDFIKWWETHIPVCFYCNQALTIGTGGKHKLTDRTIDRKDPQKGYVLDNIVFACRRCNLMKGDWLTSEQTLEIAQRYFVL